MKKRWGTYSCNSSLSTVNFICNWTASSHENNYTLHTNLPYRDVVSLCEAGWRKDMELCFVSIKVSPFLIFYYKNQEPQNCEWRDEEAGENPTHIFHISVLEKLQKSLVFFKRYKIKIRTFVSLKTSFIWEKQVSGEGPDACE